MTKPKTNLKQRLHPVFKWERVVVRKVIPHIRSAVVMRKTSYCNRSINGAETQMILMSIFKTLRQSGYEDTAVIVDALRTFYSTKELPKLPKTLQTGE